jgi:hypothetical protein
MHDVAPGRITAQNIGYNFAEGVGEQSFVDVFYGAVYIFFRCGNSPGIVSRIGNHCIDFKAAKLIISRHFVVSERKFIREVKI